MQQGCVEFPKLFFRCFYSCLVFIPHFQYIIPCVSSHFLPVSDSTLSYIHLDPCNLWFSSSRIWQLLLKTDCKKMFAGEVFMLAASPSNAHPDPHLNLTWDPCCNCGVGLRNRVTPGYGPFALGSHKFYKHTLNKFFKRHVVI